MATLMELFCSGHESSWNCGVRIARWGGGGGGRDLIIIDTTVQEICSYDFGRILSYEKSNVVDYCIV